MSQDSVYLEIEIELSLEDAQIFSQGLDDGVLPDLSGYYEVLYDEERKNPERTSLMLYFTPDSSHPALRIEILLASLGIGNATLTDRTVDRDRYLQAYRDHYGSFAISPRFVIVPSWEKGTEKEKLHTKEETISLYLDPGLAFGTGLHPTTGLCLTYLDENFRPGMRMIDAGCGSGILTAGALLLGASEVFAFDVDSNAIRSTGHNLTLNEPFEGKWTARCGGFDLDGLVDFSADLFVGNLTWNIIRANGDIIQKGSYPKMILSGILKEKKEEVLKFFNDEWSPGFQAEKDGWVLLEFLRR